jgi:hypothetical protein
MRDTLVIIGSYTPTRKDFDFSRTDCDIWVFNEAVAATWCTRADAIFQMHDRVIWSNPANRNDPNHILWLKNMPAPCNVCRGSGRNGEKPCSSCTRGTYQPPANRLDTVVYMQEQNDEVPNSKAYPLDGILDMAGRGDDHFLTSSVSQSLALAAYLGCYRKIEIYGVGMKTNTEYAFQREGVAHWLGFLRGLGVQVYLHGDTFDAPVYGFDGGVVIDYAEFGKRITELSPQIDALAEPYKEAHKKVYLATRALENDGSKVAQENVLKSVQELLTISAQVGELDGAKQENERYIQRADVMRKESGGEFIFSRQEFESAAHNLKQQADQAHTEFVSVATTLGHIERNALQAAKGSPKRTKLFELYRQTMESYIRKDNAVAVYAGAMKENYRYMQWLDQHIRAAGGAKSEAVILEALQEVVP